MRLIFGIETDGLLDEAMVIHCLVAQGFIRAQQVHRQARAALPRLKVVQGGRA